MGRFSSPAVGGPRGYPRGLLSNEIHFGALAALPLCLLAFSHFLSLPSVFLTVNYCLLSLSLWPCPVPSLAFHVSFFVLCVIIISTRAGWGPFSLSSNRGILK